MRAELALAAALLAAPAVAGDLGRGLTFRSQRAEGFQVLSGPPASRVLFDSGDSDLPGEEWDVLLIQGEMPDPGVRFQAGRTSWIDPWVDLEMHRRPDGRFWARGRFPRRGGAVRLRALDAGVRSDHRVAIYSAEVYADEPESAAPSAPPARGPADPAAAPPPMTGRADWGARPPTNPFSPDPLPWRVTLHHTDGRRTASLAESKAEALFIQGFHQNGRGWSDVGYHYLVDSVGNILEGRPLGTLGAHTLSNNEGNVGIVLLGSYHAPRDDKPTAAQLAAVASIGRFLVARFGIDPHSLKGHRDYKMTDCPGDRAYPKLPELRNAFGTPPVATPAPARAPRRTVRAPALSGALDWDQRGSSNAAAPTAER